MKKISRTELDRIKEGGAAVVTTKRGQPPKSAPVVNHKAAPVVEHKAGVPEIVVQALERSRIASGSAVERVAAAEVQIVRLQAAIKRLADRTKSTKREVDLVVERNDRGFIERVSGFIEDVAR